MNRDNDTHTNDVSIVGLTWLNYLLTGSFQENLPINNPGVDTGMIYYKSHKHLIYYL